MHQATMFHDSIYDALGSAVKAAGGVKHVAHALWPALSAEIGGARLRSCLNPEHSQKFDLAEVLVVARMARDAGDHSVMNFLGQALGYEVAPAPTSGADVTDENDPIQGKQSTRLLAKRTAAQRSADRRARADDARRRALEELQRDVPGYTGVGYLLAGMHRVPGVPRRSQ